MTQYPHAGRHRSHTFSVPNNLVPSSQLHIETVSARPPSPVFRSAGHARSGYETPANAWAGGSTSTLEFAIRAGDKELLRQERARLKRLGIDPDEHDSDESLMGSSDDQSFVLKIKDTRRGSSASRSQAASPPVDRAQLHSNGAQGRRLSAMSMYASGQPGALAPPSPSSNPRSSSPRYGALTIPIISSPGPQGARTRSSSRERILHAGCTPAAHASVLGGRPTGLARRASTPGPMPMPAFKPDLPRRSSGSSSHPVQILGFSLPSGGSTRPSSPVTSPNARRSSLTEGQPGGRISRGRAGELLGGHNGAAPTVEVSPTGERALEVS